MAQLHAIWRSVLSNRIHPLPIAFVDREEQRVASREGRSRSNGLSKLISRSAQLGIIEHAECAKPVVEGIESSTRLGRYKRVTGGAHQIA
jgi:hypothetical protein